MKIELRKLALIGALVGGLAAFYAFTPLSTQVNAAPSGAPVASTTTPALNAAFTVTAGWGDDEASTAVLNATKSGGAAGSISTCTVAVNADGQTPTTSIVAGTPTDTCTAAADLDSLTETQSMTATYTCTTAGTVTFTLTQGGSTSASTVVTCGGGGGQITLTVSSAAACGAVNVQAYVTTTAGVAAPDGTLVSFLVPQGGGSFNPASATTLGGYAFSLFTPLQQGYGVVTIQATALGQTAQTVVAVTCAGYPPLSSGPIYPGITQAPASQPSTTTTTTQPSTTQPLTAAPPPIYSISPPSTGDGGLASD